MVILLVAEKVFKKIFSCGSKDNSEAIYIDLFQKKTGILL